MSKSNPFAVPLSHEDLTEIAKRLRQWEKRMVGPNGYTDASNLVSRIEVHRPDDSDNIIGHFVLEDEWVGFRPIGEES